jgi:hypothetical protein
MTVSVATTSALHGLDIIRDSGVLREHSGTLEKFAAELHDTYLHVQQHRTRTEMEVSVLQDLKHPTPDAKYWQAMREQDVQYNELVMLGFEYQTLAIETDKLRRQWTSEEDDLELRLLDVKIAKNEFLLRLQEREGFHRRREISEWSDIKARLAPQCQHGLTDVGVHQLEALSQRFEHQADALTEGSGVADRINIVGLRQTARRMAGEV